MMDDKNLVTYKGTILQGSVGDMQAEYWTDEDWKKHAEYVDELKKSGEYLKPTEVNITMKPCPLFEDKVAPKMDSYRFIILDLSK